MTNINNNTDNVNSTDNTCKKNAYLIFFNDDECNLLKKEIFF